MSNYQVYNAELIASQLYLICRTVGQRLLPKWLMHYYQRLF